MNKILLIKYGELTTKKGNRNLFVNRLIQNIKNKLTGIEYNLTFNRVRLYIETNEYEKVIDVLKKIFGIHQIVLCHKIETDVENIKSKVLEITQNNYKTFKIETNRADKKFPIKSMDFNKQLGGFILKNTDLKVDVHNPDILVKVEIRQEGTYIYDKVIEGIKGYPVSVQGKGLVMLSGGIDSPVAAYLALKRGVALDALYFDSPPHTTLEAKNKVIKLVEILKEYGNDIKLHIINFTKIQEEIYKNIPHEYLITIMRRMMYRIAQKMVYQSTYKVIINGESIGQVASQTLDSIFVVNDVTSIPIIRPVACLDKLEIIEISKKIGTYETSILPFEDCCTVFVPKHPIINPNLDKVIEYEKLIDFENLINEAIQNKEIWQKQNNLDSLL